MQVKLTRDPYISGTKKDGSPLISRNGNPFKKVAIQTDKTKDKWLSGFVLRDDDVVLGWKSGDEVNITVEQNGDFWNFKPMTKTDLLEERVTRLEEKVFPAVKTEIPKTPQDEPPIIEDIPF